MILNDDETVIKQLNGFSGSTVYLIQHNSKLFVRKINDVDRNFERMTDLLNHGYNVPLIYNKYQNILDIEYISGLDIKTYLKFNKSDSLIEFIIDLINRLSFDSVDFDYSDVYQNKLNEIDFSLLPFTKEQLIEKLPKILPSSQYHGDLTLENILYSNDSFYLIDPVTIEYNSWVFDIAKMRQDLQCKWFLRDEKYFFDTQLDIVQSKILKQYPIANNDYLLILMLLRVYRRSVINTKEHNFLLREIIKLWK